MARNHKGRGKKNRFPLVVRNGHLWLNVNHKYLKRFELPMFIYNAGTHVTDKAEEAYHRKKNND